MKPSFFNITTSCHKQTADGQDAPLSNPWMLFRRWIANPLQMGSVVPSSPALCRRVAAHTRWAPDEAVLILAQWHGRIGTVVCGIPMVLLPLTGQRRFIDAIEAVAPGPGFLHYSYCAASPLPSVKHRLAARREAWTALNFPPASVWRYLPIVA